MKKIILLFLLAILIINNLASQNNQTLTTTMQQIATQSSRPDWIYFKYPQQINPDSVFIKFKSAFGLGNDDRMELFRSETDALGIQHNSFQQFYKNIKVEAAVYTVHGSNSKTNCANGKLCASLNINVSPVISGMDAINNAMAYTNATEYMWQDSVEENRLKAYKNDLNATYFPNPELMIVMNGYDLTFTPENFVLAYKFDLHTKIPFDSKTTFVNAITGDVIKQYDLKVGCVPTTVQTLYNGNKTIHTTNITDVGPYYNQFKLESNCNNVTVTTRYNNYNTAGDVYDNSNFSTWGAYPYQKALVQSQWGTEKMNEYMQNVLGRNSFDNLGGQMVTVIYDNAESDQAYFDFATNTVNLFKGGFQALPGTYWCSSDVVGHEWGHGLTEKCVPNGLSYPTPHTTETNGLHEGLSDIWGTLLEFYINGSVTNWKNCEDFYNYAGRNYLRDMQNPLAVGDPDTYKGTNYFNNLDGHITGQVISHWFYLLSSGGTGTNNVLPAYGSTYSYNVAAIGISDAVKILYQSYKYLHSLDNFQDERRATIQAAIDLFGACSVQAQQTKEAWNAVGVYDENSGCNIDYCFTKSDVNCSSPNGSASIVILNDSAESYEINWFSAFNGQPDVFLNTGTSIGNLQPGDYAILINNANPYCEEWIYFSVLDATNSVVFDYPNGLTINSSTQVINDVNNDGIIKIKGPVYVNANYTIINQTWHFGNDFTLDPNHTQGIPPSGMVVAAGKTLTINNAKFTGACGMWQGVQVLGSYNSRTGVVTQGKLVMQNNSEIRNAHIGVALYKTHMAYLATNNYGLGLIQTSGNCKFINNGVAIVFSAPTGVANGSNIINNSIIKDCQFYSDASLLDPVYSSLPSNYFVKVYGSSGVNITGNTFSCNNSVFYVQDRGTAIRTYNAACNIGANTINGGNVFTNLTKGIDSYATGGLKNINVISNTFNKVQQAITSTGTNYNNITANAFYVPDVTSIPTWGVYLINSQGFNVRDGNGFNKCIGCTGAASKGVIVIDGGTFAGTISKNIFNGLQIASQSEGNNGNATGGLQLKCNTYTNNQYAISVSPEPGIHSTSTPALAPQGEGCAQTDNRPVNKFPDVCSGTGNFKDINSSISINYFENLSNVNIAAPACVKTGATYVTLNQCGGLQQDNYCDISGGSGESNMQLMNQQLNSEQNPIKKRQLLHQTILAHILNSNNPNKEVVISNLLESWNTIDSRKILVPAYIEVGDYNKAQITLNQIPQDNIENINYRKLYNELITLAQNNKTVFELTAAQEQTITDVANSPTHVRYHAQSILEVTGKAHFERTPENITLSTARLAYFNSDEPEEIRSNMYDARLGNNYPNPYSNSTLIPYSLPQDAKNAIINIADVTGRLIATYELKAEEHSVEFDAKNLTEGIYYYTMYVNKKMVSTKKMIVIKQ